MIDLPYTSFLSGENLAIFFSDIKWLLFFIAPGVLIFFALDVLGDFINTIRGLFKKDSRKEDDDDYEIEHY